MANGYVPHFMRHNPIMFPGIPPRHPPPNAHPIPKHPSHFHPPNYAHSPPGKNIHLHHAADGALPAPFPGGQSYLAGPNNHGLLFQDGARAQEAQCRFPSAFPAEGPNVVQRFWIALFGPPIRLLATIFAALCDTCAFYTRPDVKSTLSTLFADHAVVLVLMSENSWSLLVGLLVVVALCAAAWVLSPKGENNTVWRSTIILSAASCYIMWAITFLAQWHPLIEPKMAKLRPGYPGGS